ncbi:hypothetical protein LTR35_017648 [Friedmanniomyces endolithicus]|nr:hypothetical protein LTR35_017648 [Friedmanniomyces endolithicus]KAK0268863.1 hypothetical protein LTS00_017455 [Friedmanniomyces endolithicus]KAK0972111.1 hypothetical protein LTR54_017642 [Friedmanniomyces endolithicus]
MGQGFPVLIIHGWTMSGTVEAHDFEPIFSKSPDYRRIYVDLPGMGDSPAGDIQDLDSMLERVSAFVDTHILSSHFLLIGTSCGAYIARALAYKYSSAVDGLLLRVPLVEPVTAKRDLDPFVPAIADAALLSSFSRADREMLGHVVVQTPEYIDRLRRRTEAIVLPAIAAADSAVLDPIRSDPDRYKLTAPLHDPETPFVKPTLILTGRQDTVVGHRDARSLLTCHPRATFVALDRADHGLPVDETNLFEALVSDWLWRVEELRQLSPSVRTQ